MPKMEVWKYQQPSECRWRNNPSLIRKKNPRLRRRNNPRLRKRKRWSYRLKRKRKIALSVKLNTWRRKCSLLAIVSICSASLASIFTSGSKFKGSKMPGVLMMIVMSLLMKLKISFRCYFLKRKKSTRKLKTFIKLWKIHP